MKKIKALMFAVVLAGMTVVSCSSDDSGPAPTINGKWNQVKTIIKIANGPSSTVKYTDNVAGCDKNYVEFASNNVYNDVVYFKQGGECQQSAADAGVWTKTDKKLIIANGGTLSGTYDIIKLSSGALNIATSNDSGGITTTTTVYFEKAK